MTRRLFTQTAAVVTLTLSAFAAGSVSAAPMSANEIKSELVGKHLKGKRLGVTMNLQLQADGSATLESTLVDDKGKWRMDGDKLCMKWDEFRGGKEQCSNFTREKKGFRMEGGPLLKIVGGS